MLRILALTGHRKYQTGVIENSRNLLDAEIVLYGSHQKPIWFMSMFSCIATACDSARGVCSIS